MNRKYNISIYTVFLIITLTALSVSCLSGIKKQTPKQEEWGLNLRGFDFSGSNFAALDGRWEFYPNNFIQPGNFSSNQQIEKTNIEVPGNWNRVFSNQGMGFGTYRTVIDFNSTVRLGILIYPIRTAYRIFINGREFKGAGRVYRNESGAWPEYHSRLYTIPPFEEGKVEIIFHVSNFHHREGGISSSILVGKYEALEQHVLGSLLKDLLFIGMFLVMGFYHLFILLLSNKVKIHLPLLVTSLAFSLWSFFNAKFIKIFYTINVSFEFALKIEYWAIIIAAVGFYFLARGLSEKGRNKIFDTIIVGSNSLFFLFVTFFPSRIFTSGLPVFLAIVILEVIYSVGILISVIHKNDKYLNLLIPGLCALVFGVLYDSFNLITGSSEQGIVAVSVFFFFLFLSIYLAKKMHPPHPEAYTGGGENGLYSEDPAASKQLEIEYIDSLTGLWNIKGLEEMSAPLFKKAGWWGKGITFVVIKLKGSDSISSLYGDNVLDDAYTLVGTVMKENFRDPDIIARIDNDLFVSLLDLGTQIHADAVYYRLQQVQNTINRTYSLPYAFTLSVGIQTIQPRKGETLESFLKMLESGKKIG